MAIRISSDRGPDQAPVQLSLDQLLLLVTRARQLDLRLDIERELGREHRYYLRKLAPAPDQVVQWTLKSNDLRDVTRYLGLDDDIRELGFPSPGHKPTEEMTPFEGDISDAGGVLYNHYHGPVELRRYDLPRPDINAPLPRKENGQLDFQATEIKDRAWVLRLKSEVPLMRVKMALHEADGDLARALEITKLPRPSYII